MSEDSPLNRIVPFPVHYKKLNKGKKKGPYIWGMAHISGENRWIEMDPATLEAGNGHEHLGTLIHETIHLILPFLSEDAVLEVEAALAVQLWANGYRRGAE